MLNFGGFQGHQILSQAIQNGVQNHAQRKQMEEQKAYRDKAMQMEQDNRLITQAIERERLEMQKKATSFDQAQKIEYLAIQKQYAEQARVRGEMETYVAERQVNELKKQDYAKRFFDTVVPRLSVNTAPVQKDRSFMGIGNDYTVNQADDNIYLSPKLKDGLYEKYMEGARKQGIDVGATDFDGVYNAMLGHQATSIYKAMMNEKMSDKDFNQDEFNKMMNKSQAGAVIKQAILAESKADAMSSGFVPEGMDESLGWGSVAGYAGVGALKYGQFMNAVGIGKTAYKQGAGKAVQQAIGNTTRKRMGTIVKLASTERGRDILTKKLAKKGGAKFAEKMVAKMAIKAGGAGVSNMVPVAGQAVSAGLGVLTLVDLYKIAMMLGDDE
jgi:hypothetical protein